MLRNNPKAKHTNGLNRTRLVNGTRDPPGQKCFYIFPGDTNRETYRLSTFKHFPEELQVYVCFFAYFGFFFTGFKDRVKCFSCGQAVEGWNINDDVSSPEWHKSDCLYIMRQNTANQPMDSSLFNLQRDERINRRLCIIFTRVSVVRRHARQPVDLHDSSPMTPVEYLHTDSSFQVSSSNVGATSNADVIEISNSPNVQTLSPSLLYPCLNPISPHMRRKEARMQTFLDYANWSTFAIRATPEEIADAGMFCLGERDRAKCWYCNGGLQNWDFEDDPWEEHAKWFPKCEYVLQRKGPEYVQSIVSRFPNLRRPTLRNPATTVPVTRVSGLEPQRFRDALQISTSTERIRSSPGLLETGTNANETDRMIEREMLTSTIVLQARNMGFNETVIRHVLKRKFEANNLTFSSFDELLTAIFAFDGANQPSTLPMQNGNYSNSSMRQANITTRSNELQYTNSLNTTEMEIPADDNICPMCYTRERCTVLMPCGHFACCSECRSNVRTCPICNEAVERGIPIFLG